VLYTSDLVAECAAFGLPDATLGEAVHVVVALTGGAGGKAAPPALLATCRCHLPAYMVPATITLYPGPLPRNPNGKIDRRTLAAALAAAADQPAARPEP